MSEHALFRVCSSKRKLQNTMEMLQRVWLITGASSGFGRAMTEIVLQKGDIAVATLRKPDILSDLATRWSTSQLLVLKLDVTDSSNVKVAFAQAIATFGRIDIVFNNAGYSMFSELEGTPDEAARALFEVNLWGAINVSKEAIRVFREINKPMGGRLIQVSSSAAVTGIPTMSIYTASKYALEGVSESLAGELDPDWNIKVIILEPGAFRTNVLNSAVRIPSHPAYTRETSPAASIRQILSPLYAGLSDADKAMEAVYKATTLADPPLRLPLGKDVLAMVRNRQHTTSRILENYSDWSEDLGADNNSETSYVKYTEH